MSKAPRPEAPTFQEIILRLQRYWADNGCVVMQPYDNEVGAGTFHTATTLRSLGPDTWRTCYVQGCRRPTDGRYGENPNRLYQHHQFQVVLKPAPVNIVDLYLGSLKVLGIDTPQGIVARFDEPLFALSGDDMYGLLLAARRSAGVRECYPFGEAHHLIAAPGFDAGELARELAGQGFRDVTVRPADAGIEDVFIKLMRHE